MIDALFLFVMQGVPFEMKSSWLSLVAETAGVSGATIARIELRSSQAMQGPLRAIVQIRDRSGQVMGATTWEGMNSDLIQGVQIDLGCDLGAALGTTVIGWLVEPGDLLDDGELRRRRAPQEHALQYFDPIGAMKLMLQAPAVPLPEAA